MNHSSLFPTLLLSFRFIAIVNSRGDLQDPAGIFELIEVVGNGTYGQVYKVSACLFFVLLCYLFMPIAD